MTRDEMVDAAEYCLKRDGYALCPCCNHDWSMGHANGCGWCSKEDRAVVVDLVLAALSTPAPVAAPPADLVAIVRDVVKVWTGNTTWNDRMAAIKRLAAFPLPEVPDGKA